MYSLIVEFLGLLTPRQRRRLWALQALVILMAFAEIVSVVAIGPFMAVVANLHRLSGHGKLATLFQMTGLQSPKSFLLLLGAFVLLLLVCSAAFSMFALWRLFVFGATVGAELAERLFSHYLHQPWLFHANAASSNLTKQIAQESQRVTSSVIIPLMQMNAKLVLALFMLTGIFLYNPMVAIVGALVFIVCYSSLYVTVRRRLIRNGIETSESQSLRFKLMLEGFGGVKDVLILGRQRVFTDRFREANRQYSEAFGASQTLTQAPRYAIEAVAYGLIIVLILYLLARFGASAESILPTLSVYALAGFKLLPALQNTYQSISKIRSNVAAFEAIRDDLIASAEGEDSSDSIVATSAEAENFPIKQAIRLEDVTFCYPGRSEPALKNVSMEIGARQVVGLVGATGSGKSTAIDLMLGLIDPRSGQLSVDGQRITAENRRRWQDSLGYVPQSIFLSDASIRENIAFGLAPEQIDEHKIERAARLAHLDELLGQFSEGLNTRVGERGVQLSGGQRQRIGIARALYNDADVLIFDEATSALDGITEKLIMEAIHDFSGHKTIIMIAHRLGTVRRCNRIYLMRGGEIIDSGTYEELREKNAIFREMADHS